MYTIIYAHTHTSTELNVFECGHESVDPGHVYGPAVRDFYLMHFILEGSGVVEQGGRIEHLKVHDGFVVFPGVITSYKADDTTPWTYVWLGFSGTKSRDLLQEAGLSSDHPFFSWTDAHDVPETFDRLMSAKTQCSRLDLAFSSGLYWLLSRLSPTRDVASPAGADRSDAYVRTAVEFIQNHYSKKIVLTDIAQVVGLNKNYLCDLFQHAIGISPYHYLLGTRIDRACELLTDERLSVADIARSVGYDDALQFSKVFKKFKGLAPSTYRRDFLLAQKQMN